MSSFEVEAVSKVLLNEYLGMGEDVCRFELAIKSYLGTEKEVVCVNTGTSALHLALASLGVQEGDEVLVPSLTYVASFQAISATGAKPVACEVDASTLFMDVNDAKSKITSRTKAIMPVHYASSSKGMVGVYELAKTYHLRVIEDAAQAFGCMFQGEYIGAHGDVICFSFDGIKNITSGEGGAIITSDVALLERLRDGRLLGVEKDTEKRYSGQRSWDFDVKHQGFRFHMNNINAAIGLEQLKRIESFKKSRQDIVKGYLLAFEDLEEVVPLGFNYDEIIPHIFVVKVQRRDELRKHLLSQGVECGVHYKPNHLLEKYTEVQLPITENIYEQILSLPCHVDLTREEQAYVVEMIRNFYYA